ncbi:hypothetical protein K0T92_12915 [Paenibacillus oenotherae]|uniref:DUF4870 domain-containing protein n=1 Tax=Paenibacillus oenotherae TaxID=1435645 RepID=A0ABS7D7Z2_9BACL|nr:hypothetical protein [Paenibacillus oenotherae]MBW7475647.1 hypothetical protein [Paenibacillus oenotherae]
MQSPSMTPDPSSTGMDPKIVGLLCYLGAFITGIIFLVVEKNSRFVKFHAMQSIIVFGALFVFSIVINIIPIIGTLIGLLITPIGFVLWIVLMLLAYQGRWFKLPVIGDIAEQQANRF